MDKRQLWRQYGYVLNLTREFINPQVIRKSNPTNQVNNSKLEFRNRLECYSRLCGKILKSLSMYSDQILNNTRQQKLLDIKGLYPGKADTSKPARPIGIPSNWSFDGILLVLYYCWNDVHVKDRITLIHCLSRVLKNLVVKSQTMDSNSKIDVSFEVQQSLIGNLEFGSPEDAIYRFLIFCLTEDSSKLNNLKKLGRQVSDAIYSKGNPIKTWKELARVTNLPREKIESDNTLFCTTVSECKRIKDIALLIVSLQLLYSSGTDISYICRPLKSCIFELQRIINRIEGNRGCYHEFDDVMYFRDSISIAHALRLLNYEDFNIFKILLDATISRHKDDSIKDSYIHLPLITLVDCSQASGALLYAKLKHCPMMITIICNVKIILHKLGFSNQLDYDEIESSHCYGLCPDCQNEIQQSYQGDAVQLEVLANKAGMSAVLLAGKAGVLCDHCSRKLNIINSGIEATFVKKQPITLWKSLYRHLTQMSNTIINSDQELSTILNKTIDNINMVLEQSKPTDF